MGCCENPKPWLELNFFTPSSSFLPLTTPPICIFSPAWLLKGVFLITFYFTWDTCTEGCCITFIYENL